MIYADLRIGVLEDQIVQIRRVKSSGDDTSPSSPLANVMPIPEDPKVTVLDRFREERLKKAA
jgi:hypothetical protein